VSVPQLNILQTVQLSNKGDIYAIAQTRKGREFVFATLNGLVFGKKLTNRMIIEKEGESYLEGVGISSILELKPE